MTYVSTEQLHAARKKLKTSSVKQQQYMVLTLFQAERIVLPYDAGLKIIEALEHAEKSHDRWGDVARLIPLERGDLIAGPMPHGEYERIKLAALLGVSTQDLRDAEEQEQRQQQSP
jgi:hypothetical protein